jgi:hypothetical protein
MKRTMLLLLLFVPAQVLPANVTEIGCAYYVEGSATYCDPGGGKLTRNYNIPGDSAVSGTLKLCDSVIACSKADGLSVSVGPVCAWDAASSDNRSDAYAGLQYDFKPVSAAVGITLHCNVDVYAGDKPSGAYATLIDLTDDQVLDECWWRCSQPEPGMKWDTNYLLDPSHDYRLQLEASADAADDGTWSAQISATFAPEPAMMSLMLFGIPLLRIKVKGKR